MSWHKADEDAKWRRELCDEENEDPLAPATGCLFAALFCLLLVFGTILVIAVLFKI
jgi:hypothetical protein